MSPHALTLRKRRDNWALKLVHVVCMFNDYVQKLHLAIDSQTPVSHLAMNKDFQSLQDAEIALLRQVNFSIQVFQGAQNDWQREIDGQNPELKTALTVALKSVKFDWGRQDNLGEQIDAAHLKWGAFSVASLGGEKTSVSEQVTAMVANGATVKDFIDILADVGHMPQVLGASQYRHACMLGIALTMRSNRQTSNLQESKDVLVAFDRAHRLMQQAQGIASETIERLAKMR